MKWWRLILAIYVLVLSGLPCEAFCPEETITNQTALPASDNHEHDESCSPFCLCATCPGFTIPQAPQLLGETIRQMLIAGMVACAYQPPHSFDLPGRIWQPPRFD